MKERPPNNNETTRPTAMSSEEEFIPPLRLDPGKYREHMEDFDLSDEQQHKLLETLWNIMRTFVEIGFGLDSVQMFSSPPNEKAGTDSGNRLGMEEGTQDFNRAAITYSPKEEDHE